LIELASGFTWPCLEARKRAKDYVGYVLTQRTGPVFIDTGEKRDDLSIVHVPEASCSASSSSRTATWAPASRGPTPVFTHSIFRSASAPSVAHGAPRTCCRVVPCSLELLLPRTVAVPQNTGLQVELLAA